MATAFDAICAILSIEEGNEDDDDDDDGVDDDDDDDESTGDMFDSRDGARRMRV